MAGWLDNSERVPTLNGALFGACPPPSPACPPGSNGDLPGCGPTVFAPPTPPPSVAPQRVELDPSALTRLLTALPPLTVGLSPYTQPPFRAQPYQPRVRGVILVPAASDAAAHAGGLALAQAEQLQLGAEAALVPVAPAAVGAFGSLARIALDPGRVAVLRSMRISSTSWEGLRALRVQLRASGRLVVAERDWSVGGGMPVEVPIYVELQPRQELQIDVRSLDPHSSHLVEVALDGWTWPIVAADDAEQAALLRQDPALAERWGGCP